MELERRKLIVHKFHENPGVSNRKLAKSLNLDELTVRKVLKRYNNTLSIERAPRVYPKPMGRNPTMAKAFVRNAVRKPTSSLQRAQALGTSVTFVQSSLQRAGYKAYKVIKAPRRNEKQSLTVKTRVRRLYDKILLKRTGCILMDDETYQYADTAQTKGVEHYAKERLGVQDKHKFKYLDKFPEKYMVWQAICTCGLKTDIFVAKGTMTADVYLKECLKKRVLPILA